jgi:hypothetical protein
LLDKALRANALQFSRSFEKTSGFLNIAIVIEHLRRQCVIHSSPPTTPKDPILIRQFAPLPVHLKAQIVRELDRLEILLEQLKTVEAETGRLAQAGE